ncbi:unnamed protein product [Rotaria sp. Silwood2]|nr:unnamed protein product [Rotaria sp. Silwood2]CAF4647855.1 unnamed protein product [Rotaria sp. Silwood2]
MESSRRSSSRKTYHVPYCNGRACPKCGQCLDWYYGRKHSDHDRVVCKSHLGPLVGPVYGWQRRKDATCGYRSYPHYVYYTAPFGPCKLSIHQHKHLVNVDRGGIDNPERSVRRCWSSHVAIHGRYLCHCQRKD